MNQQQKSLICGVHIIFYCEALASIALYEVYYCFNHIILQLLESANS